MSNFFRAADPVTTPTPSCSPGLVTADPKLPLDKTLIPSPPTRPKNPVFENEDMGKVRTHSPTQLWDRLSSVARTFQQGVLLRSRVGPYCLDQGL